ncbi:unnamed protein product [Thelazia callipaeda]|uniref:SWI5-dependent HO expression protein 3 n=1 Tax=Thelazia callipaeda TaxID=103827 RepID=A0A0N5CQA9_THECL|nr:unnamed protein product [Thelazia callipaeda]
MQQENSSKCGEVASLKRELEKLQQSAANRNKLQTEFAKLQILARNLQHQKSLQSMHDSLLMDYDRIQAMHDLLNADYERAKCDNDQLKIRLKNQKEATDGIMNELKELKGKFVDERARCDHEVEILRQDLTALRNEHDRVKEESFSRTQDAECNAQSLREFQLAEQEQRAFNTHLTLKIEDLQRNLEARDLEIAELRQQIKMLTHVNSNLENKNRILHRKMEHLLTPSPDFIRKITNSYDNDLHDQIDMQAKKVVFKGKISLSNNHSKKFDAEKVSVKEIPQTFVKRTASKSYISQNDVSRDSLAKFVANGTTCSDTKLSSGINGFSVLGNESAAYSAEGAPVTARNSPFSNGFQSAPDVQPSSSSDELNSISSSYISRHSNVEKFRRHSGPSSNSSRAFLRNVVCAEYSSIRRRAVSVSKHSADESVSLNGSERGVDVPPPNQSRPLRSCSQESTNLLCRALSSRPPPPAYQPKTSTKQFDINTQPSQSSCQTQLATSVGRLSQNEVPASKQQLAVDEVVSSVNDISAVKRTQRLIHDRKEKAVSIYENVNQEQSGNNLESNTVWYEYGCV